MLRGAVIAITFAIAGGAPAFAQDWTVGREGSPAQITASHRMDSGVVLEYAVGIENVRSFKVGAAGCGVDRGFDTPAGDAAARHDVVYDKLFDAMDAAAATCGIDLETAKELLAGFDDAYVEAERLAAARDAAAPAAPIADRTQEIAGWRVADVTEDGERKLRMRRSVGEADLEYRVMAGVDRRMNLMVGGCGSNAMIDLPEAEAGRLAKAKAELAALIKDVAGSCKLPPAAPAGLAAGFNEAFAAIEAWGRQHPLPGY